MIPDLTSWWGRVVLFTGGREYEDITAVRRVFSGLRPRLAIHGAATGLDSLAEEVARELGVPTDPHPAPWTELGALAGHVRNREMVALRPDICVAFPGGSGTADCVRQARAAGIPILRVSRTGWYAWEEEPVET